ncbi:RtcB family protein [Phytohabitans kaempferiae]|uniref:3'-phosphate/5'-hydroxy nucleic acid ligase n=1 Tax=Phytohabitans kaempferiae TaxID=1620943 RepID=A0ABV6M3K3_9ACTN
MLDTAGTPRALAEAAPGLDSHKGAGIPIGTVLRTTCALIPQAVGNDINCGMRVEVTDLTIDRVRPTSTHWRGGSATCSSRAAGASARPLHHARPGQRPRVGQRLPRRRPEHPARRGVEGRRR